MAKWLLNRSFDSDRRTAFDEEAWAQEMVVGTADAAEGLARLRRAARPPVPGLLTSACATSPRWGSAAPAAAPTGGGCAGRRLVRRDSTGRLGLGIGPVDLELSDEQAELKAAVAAVLERECPMSLVRGVVEEGAEAEELWAQMVALDWPALAVDEGDGGLGWARSSWWSRPRSSAGRWPPPRCWPPRRNSSPRCASPATLTSAGASSVPSSTTAWPGPWPWPRPPAGTTRHR